MLKKVDKVSGIPIYNMNQKDFFLKGGLLPAWLDNTCNPKLFSGNKVRIRKRIVMNFL